MNARENLIRCFERHSTSLAASTVADEILNQHARELAERIRNSEELRDLTDDHMGDCDAAADLIDVPIPSEGI